MPTIEIKGVTKIYKTERRRKFMAVADVDLTIEQGEFVFLIGSRGAGKSTLLQLISGSLKPKKGKVVVGGYNVHRLHLWNKRGVARLFGQVWQEPQLLRKKTVAENLHMAMIGNLPFSAAARYSAGERIMKILGLVGVRGRENCYPAELTYAELRRVELARALMNSPPILLLDELTEKLDDDSIWDIMQLLQDINRRGTTVILATHASQYVNLMRRRVITLVDGRVFSDVPKGKFGNVV